MTTQAWRGRRVLVTGARGFIGSRLCRGLMAEGTILCGVSSAPMATCDSMSWRRVDLTNRDATRALLSECSPEFVFHLAGHVSGSQNVAQVAPTFDLNLGSTVNVLTAAVESGQCRVILAGSMREPAPDDVIGVLGSPYAASKWASSGYARMYHSLYDLPVSIARLFMVYGPGQWDTTKLLPYVIKSFLHGESPRVSSGTASHDWVFVDDVVSALLRVAEAPFSNARPIDVGSGVLVSVREIVERVHAIMEAPVHAQFGAIPDRTFDRLNPARVDETRQLIGWTAETSLDDGLRQAVQWYRGLAAGHSGAL